MIKRVRLHCIGPAPHTPTHTPLPHQVYCCNHICGSHFNPAVTWAVAIRQGLRLSEVPSLVVVSVGQTAGAILGALTVLFAADQVGA
jgi:glycerol uptake facilitator-like aquaporin